jgi:hypothetical protein
MFQKSISNNFQMIAISILKMMMFLPKLTMKKMKSFLFAKMTKCLTLKPICENEVLNHQKCVDFQMGIFLFE